jgi:HEPN domain-containing protein
LTPEQSEGERFLRAAQSDLRAVQLLSSDSAQGADVIGFHAQQSVEKALKCVLVLTGREIPYTHDLSYLLDLCDDDETVQVPTLMRDADWLTPWAVAARYGTELGELDRDAAVALAVASVDWAATVLAATGESDT